MASTSETLGSVEEREEITAQEARLARRAAEGDGAAFATLYDRYEGRIYNFCHRLLGSADDAADATQDAFLKVLQRLPKLEGRELNFSAYLFTAARNASYDMIGKRKRATPVDEIPERGGGAGARDPGDLDLDPERTAMLDSQQAEIREANGRLPQRQREVLALRELEDRSYDEIAEIMGMNRNSVAQLISRARIKLRDELRGSALASVAATSIECERALPLIAARGDGQLSDDDDSAWLETHLAGCDTCRVSEQAMEEAGTSYRAWLPLVPILWLRKETIAKAAELVGSDWSHIANSPRNDGPANGSSGGGGGGAADADGAEAVGAVARQSRFLHALRSRRRAGLILIASAALLLGVFAAIVIGDDGQPKSPADTTGASGSQAAAVVTTDAQGHTVTVKKKKGATPAGAATTGSTVVTTTLPSGQVTTRTLPVVKHRVSRHQARRKRRTQGGSNAGGGGGQVNLPVNSTPTTVAQPAPQNPAVAAPPPNTTSTQTTSTPSNNCSTAIACRPSGGGGTTTTTTTATPPTRTCRDPRTGRPVRC